MSAGRSDGSRCRPDRATSLATSETGAGQAPDNITPAYMFDAGLPTATDPNFPMPPYLDPSIDNNLQTDWWGGGNTASRPGYYDSWTFSAQRELTGGLTAEVDYNGSYGKDLPTGLHDRESGADGQG